MKPFIGSRLHQTIWACIKSGGLPVKLTGVGIGLTLCKVYVVYIFV